MIEFEDFTRVEMRVWLLEPNPGALLGTRIG